MKAWRKSNISFAFKIFTIALLLYTLVIMPTTSPLLIMAEGEQGDKSVKPGHGMIGNEEGEKDLGRAIINKQVSFGSKPGEYFIDLTVKGKDNTKIDTMDIVLVYDLSNSMENNKIGDETRTKVAHDATEQFVNGLLATDSNFRMAFVPYGTSVMDGETRSYLGNPGNYSFNQLNTNNYYVGNFTDDPIVITSKIPKSISHGNHGGTFTQQALERAGQIISTSGADHKVIVTITDGLPTISYNANRQSWGTGAENQGDQNMKAHRTNTINEANGLKGSYLLYAIGVGLSSGNTAQKEVIEGISNSAADAYFANTVQQLVDALTDISQKLSNSIVDGSINDPITDEFLIKEGSSFTKASNDNLTDGEYFLSASESSLLAGVTVKVEGKDLKIDGLNLGEDDEVTIRYKVQVDTDNLELDPNTLYKTNGEATLTPMKGADPLEFPVPEASTVPIEVSGEKFWEDFGYLEYRPENITVQLYREINGVDTMVKEVDVSPDDEGKWKYVFEDVFLYDTNGEPIDYRIVEVLPEELGIQYEAEYTDTDITNKLKQNAEIKIEKIGVSESQYGADFPEVGKNINYTFTITNTGNLPLKNITLTDELTGISEFTYETLNGEPFTGDISELVMNPDDVLLATATYEVTQENFDFGQVTNKAKVTGTPTVPDPTEKFDDTPVTDESEVKTPGELDPSISLEKVASKRVYTTEGEEIVYTFTVKNTGNTILTNVNLNDQTFNTTIGLTKKGEETKTEITLAPGETAEGTFTYSVAEEDMVAGKIENTATVTGTPPPAYTEAPGNPENVTATDNETVYLAGLSLEKTSDKNEITEAGEKITYTFTVTNTGNVTLENVKINDPLLGGEITLEQAPLEPNESTTGTATYTVTQDDIDNGGVTNVATASGTPENGDPNNPVESPPAEVEVKSDRNTTIQLTKTADKQEFTSVGEEITYTFTVTNTGNVTLTEVKVDDETFKLDVALDKATLTPGESANGTYTHTVTQADLDAGKIVNVATAEGTPRNFDPEDPDSEKPTDEDRETVTGKQEPSIALEKTVNHDKVYAVGGGDQVTYTFVVTNTGNVTLDNVTVNDPLLGGEITLEQTTLAPNESTTGTATYTVTEADYDRGYVDNQATATGTPPGKTQGDPDNPTANDETTVQTKHPAIQLIKTSDTTKITEEGQIIRYTFKVKNAGNTTLENIKISDEMIPGRINVPKTTLAPNESVTAYAKYVVKADDLTKNTLPNIATVTGTPVGYDDTNPKSPQPVEDTDEEVIPTEVETEKASIQLEKTSNPKQVEAGDMVTYTFKVTNTGKVALENVKVDDPHLGGNITLDQTTLAPGESTKGTATYIVTTTDIDNGEINNTAKATGLPEGHDPDDPGSPQAVEDEDTDTIYAKGKLPPMNPAIKLILTTDTDLIIEEGQVITYFYKVTNTGDTTLEDVALIDPLLGEQMIVPLAKTKLVPGESTYGVGTYIATADDVGKKELPNKATTFGYSPMFIGDRINLEEIVQTTSPEDRENAIMNTIFGFNTALGMVVPFDIDNESIPTLGSSVELSKTADTELVERAGQVITYMFKIKNTGEVRIKNVELNDPMLEGKIELGGLSLEPGETKTITKEYIVTEADLEKDEIINVAVVQGEADNDDPEEDDPKDEDEIRIPTIKGQEKPSIQLEKTSDKDIVTSVGEEITYTFVVTNTGKTTLTDVEVDDPMLGGKVTLDKTTLASGEQATGKATYTVAADDLTKMSIDNVAIATGTPEGHDPADPDSPQKPVDTDEMKVYTNIIPPGKASIKLLKTSDTLLVERAGEVVTYHFKVTNNGDVALKDIQITDDMLADAGITEIHVGKTKLNPGESTTATAKYTVTQTDINRGSIDNIASVTGTPPGADFGNPNNPKDEDENSIPTKKRPGGGGNIEVPTEENASIAIEKTVEQGEIAKAGDKITYHFLVTNTGDVALSGVKVNDPMLETAGINVKLAKTTLAPGEQTTGKATYTVTQTDIDKGTVKNIATASGNVPDKPTLHPESPPSEAEVKVKQNSGISIEKTANVKEISKVGQKITYTFSVKNTGNVTLNDVLVYDKTLDKTVEVTKPTLKPGETTTGTLVYEVTQADLDRGEIPNVAIATGTPPDDEDSDKPGGPGDSGEPGKPGEGPIAKTPEIDEDEVIVKTKHKPKISLEKTSNKNEIPAAGEIIIYTFKVTNIGNVTVENIAINDPMLGGKIPLGKDALAPGESTRVTKEYVVTKDDVEKGEIVNVATVDGIVAGGGATKEVKVSAEGKDVLPETSPSYVGKVVDGLLPKTATNTYMIISIGIMILLLGLSIQIVKRKVE